MCGLILTVVSISVPQVTGECIGRVTWLRGHGYVVWLPLRLKGRFFCVRWQVPPTSPWGRHGGGSVQGHFLHFDHGVEQACSASVGASFPQPITWATPTCTRSLPRWHGRRRNRSFRGSAIPWHERGPVTDQCHDRSGKPGKRSDKKLGQMSSQRQSSDARAIGLRISGHDAAEVYSPEEH